MGLHHRVLATAERHPARTALEVDGRKVTYEELVVAARRIAGAITSGEGEPRTAILGHRSAHALAGVLGCGIAGHAYVPVHAGYPADRVREMIDRSGVRTFVVDATALALAVEVLPTVSTGVVIVEDPAAADRFAGGPHRVVVAGERDPIATTADLGPDAEANVLFTSGSTGRPKGVRVTHGNVGAFLDAVLSRYELGPTDRFTHLFDLVFDLAGFDLWAAWSVGAAVIVPNKGQTLLPGRYAAETGITVWFSVPSSANLAAQQKALQPGALPGVRYALFCGEALSAEVAAKFQAAAPSAVVENLYGPTEVALACTAWRWHPERGADEAHHGIVPIGVPFPGLRARVSDPEGREVAPGEVGELWMTGPQVALGYLGDPEQTARAFVEVPGDPGRWYRTGDRVRRPVAAGEPMAYLGRGDSQVQVNGFRVEVGEVEAALRKLVPDSLAAVIPWPPGLGRCDALIGFVGGDFDGKALRRELASRLPFYMVPREIRVLPALPLNVNGKIDRKHLAALLG
jgi:amino acid adenylation domain-containing protein